MLAYSSFLDNEGTFNNVTSIEDALKNLGVFDCPIFSIVNMIKSRLVISEVGSSYMTPQGLVFSSILWLVVVLWKKLPAKSIIGL